MTALRILVGGHEYDVACDDGQENHLKSLARQLDGQIRSLGGPQSKGTEAHLLLLAALTLTDDLQDTQRELERCRQDIHYNSQSFEQGKQIELENAVASTIQTIAERIEAIAGELEKV